MSEGLDKKGIIKAISIALTAAILGIVVLGWQYNNLAKKQFPALEGKIEQNSAQDVLRRFLETRADIFLTERAVEQKSKGEFTLEEGIKYYEILKTDRLADGSYKFNVKVGNFIEIITITKILGSYYIDSIETAG
ncbi:MAG: hypothetical protein HYT20_01650 [Candidatus Nealsonbacteria bacterium]|nr:hypothetical protein [Candidatus Nealsonbacteria bacterium]